MKFLFLILAFSIFLESYQIQQFYSNSSQANSLSKSIFIFKRKPKSEEQEDEPNGTNEIANNSPKSQAEQGNTKDMIKKSVKKAKDKCKGDKECLRIAEKLESDFLLLIDKLRKDDVENEQECLRCTLKNLVKLYEIDEHMESEEEPDNTEGVHYKKA